MERCEVCGTENRSNAKFCRGCARALMPIEADAEAQKLASNRALRCSECQAIYSRGATVCAACGHSLDLAEAKAEPEVAGPAVTQRRGWVFGTVALIALAVAVGMWFLGGAPATQGQVAPAGNQASTSASAMKAVALPPPEPVEAAKPVAETLDEAQKAHYEELVRREAERAERARQTMDRLAAKEKALSEARASKAAAEKRRADAALATPQPADAAAPAAGAVPGPTPSGAAPVAPAVPSTAPTRTTVEQACAKETNFLARDLCRVDACRVAANANDPICVWYRRLEEERRNRLNN